MGDSADTPSRSSRPNAFRKHKVNFQGVTTCYPVNIDVLGLRRSLRIASLKRKQLDHTIDYVRFNCINKVSDEVIGPLKEHFTFKVSVKSSYEENFMTVMVKEIHNQTNREHWKYFLKVDTPVSLILLSTWTFRMNRNRSTGDVIKLKLYFCTDDHSQESRFNSNETCYRLVKWNTMRSCLTMVMLNNWHAKAIDFEKSTLGQITMQMSTSIS